MSDDDAEAATFPQAGEALAEAVQESLGTWLAAVVERRAAAGGVLSAELRRQAAAAGEAATADVMPRLRALLAMDIDDQRTTPLEIVRTAVPYGTAVLAAAKIAPGHRDSFDESRFPDDLYGLTPSKLADLGDDVGEASIVWGAAKAYEHKRRHAR